MAGVRVLRLRVQDTELEADLLQRSESGVQDAAMVHGDRDRRIQRRCRGIEGVECEVVESAAPGHAYEREADDADLVDPAGTPIEFVADADGSVDVVVVPSSKLMGTWHQREHQRTTTRLLPQRHRPIPTRHRARRLRR